MSWISMWLVLLSRRLTWTHTAQKLARLHATALSDREGCRFTPNSYHPLPSLLSAKYLFVARVMMCYIILWFTIHKLEGLLSSPNTHI